MTAFTLKIIASSCMLIDHIGAVFSSQTPEFFRLIGRIAFPIFAYLAAQGCKRTKNINNYLLRLGIFALISEIPFDAAFMSTTTNGISSLSINFLSDTNVFYTLFLGVSCIAVYERLKLMSVRSYVAFLAVFPLIMAAVALKTDYGMFGTALIFLLYLADPENKLTRTIVLFAGMAYHFGIRVLSALITTQETSAYIVSVYYFRYFLFSLVAVVLVYYYNGQQGPKYKWTFYVFYPAHIAILAIIANC